MKTNVCLKYFVHDCRPVVNRNYFQEIILNFCLGSYYKESHLRIASKSVYYVFNITFGNNIGETFFVSFVECITMICLLCLLSQVRLEKCSRNYVLFLVVLTGQIGSLSSLCKKKLPLDLKVMSRLFEMSVISSPPSFWLLEFF